MLSFPPLSDRIESHRRMVSELCSPNYHAADLPAKVFHAIAGIVTEAGEMMDVIKKFGFYNKPIDYDNLNEEMGDLLWYVQLYCIERNISIVDLLAMNERKLRARYGDSWSQDAAENRNLKAEYEAMQDNNKP